MPTIPLRRKLWLTGGVLVAVCLMPCGYLGCRPVPEPVAADDEALVAWAERWWHPGDDIRYIPKTEWSPEVRRLNPAYDPRADHRGLFIPCGGFFVQEWGLFVLPPGSPFRPPVSGDPRFRLIRGRLYRYDIEG
jgi:hypothetical protein